MPMWTQDEGIRSVTEVRMVGHDRVGLGLVERLAPMVAALCLVLLASVAQAGATVEQDLQRDLERAIANAGLEGMQVGVSVVDLRTGRRLADIDADQPLIPASNMKLLTSASALLSLGEGFMFETRFELEGERLIVVGSGDPGFGDPALLADLPKPMDIDAMLDFVVDAITQSGATTLREIVIDDRVFDREAVHPSWPTEQLQYYYCAEVSGLNFHLNMVNVFAYPTSMNQPARVVIEPEASAVEVQNTTSTVASRTSTGRPQPSSIHIRRDGEGNRLLVSGRVSRSVGAPTSLRDPAMVFGQLLAERLELAGVVIGAPHEAPADVVRRPEARETLDGRPILIIKTPITEVLRRCNSDSYNLHAEALFKKVGHQWTGQAGSWSMGAAAMRAVLVDAIGPNAVRSLRIADGSGMSRQNAMSADTLCALLAHMNQLSNEPARAAFLDSLVRPGEGTLSRNFMEPEDLRHEIFGKTGFLNGVRSFSGYVAPKGSDRPAVAFAILMNGFDRGQSLRSRELRNEMVRLIDRASASLSPGAVVVEPGTP
jgi:D-alanyl-D-alanine carboxypeptidase/D-alanyl-D-alanine-endopeptidase (penicillin-binding protein 4)